MIVNEQRLTFVSMLKSWWSTKNVNLTSLIVQNRIVGGIHLGTLLENDYARVRDALAHIFQLLAQGHVKPRIHAIEPMSRIVEATKLLAERKNIGKVLLSVKE